MHLKSLTLRGFKSFASATTMKFEPGICAVVGPNGSGKSNVVDALTWVMGEQGAKNLRGGKMQDVIFAGAGDRKPLGRAEVTLTIDNTDGKLPIEYSEVSITRRMFRDGASEYEINGAKARLMDIQELLSDSGIGREMHIVVGQNKLGDILASRPEERRAYIEEAAGVLKHRRRKEKAQRKLQGMQANLDRLQDLTDELGKQLKPLARQAETAQRAATVQADLRDARLKLAGDRVVTLRAELEKNTARAEELHAQVETASERLDEATAHQQVAEQRLEELTPAAEEAQQLWFRLSTLAERLSATTRIAQERADNAGTVTAYRGPDPDDLEAQAQRADEEHAELVEEAEIAAEKLEDLREQVAEKQEIFDAADAEHMAQVRAIADRREGVVRLLAQEESLTGQITSAEQEIERASATAAETRERVRAADKEVADAAQTIRDLAAQREPLHEAHVRASAEAQAADKRLDQLRDEQRQRERSVYSLSARIDTLQESAPRLQASELLDDTFAPVSDRIRLTDVSLARALSAALGAHAEALSGSTTKGVVATLAEASRTVVIDDSLVGESWRMDADLPAGTHWLLDSVHIDDSLAVPINRLLADVVVAPDLDTAFAVIDQDPRLRAVTAEGVVVGEGWIQAGTGSTSSVETSAQIEQATAELEEAKARLDELAGTLEGARTAAEEARVAAASATAALREHDAVAESWQRDHKRLQKQYEANRKEHERSSARATDAEASLAQLRDSLAETRDRLARVQADDEPEEASTEQRDRAAEALNQIKAMEVEAQLAARQATERAGQKAGRGDALRRQAEHEREAKARHERAMTKRRLAGELAGAVAKHARDVAARTDDALSRATDQRDELTRQRGEVNQQVSRLRSEVQAARRQVDQLTENAHSAEIARSQAQVRVDEAEGKIVEQLGVPISDLLRDYTPGEDFDRAAEKARQKQAEKDLRSLGKVNPLALEEYRAQEERYDFLATQLDDVLRARRDLTQVIEDVDAQILQLFTDAWADVEKEFPKVFDTLFPGGEGRLVLTEPEDMLTTGIEVEARPPGKKVKRLSLLSGGEKSLTALALLVAIFRARPSPFYVMDEVEAALDDVNLRRLIALFEELRKDSQLIVITHQKPTMDVANVLYGVTMRGDGITRVLSQRMNPEGQAPGAGV
ncbi:chromosome segregation protein SMC [Corynebacterium yudongzhengii]|uniref:Chromosome partition protein Smc n=1 Tax=Corynebacterium yudongzhengii TaxID=2080740 RepID=A0A2U1T6A8_9CORY|nr:chromosome segregation protein SMC [Corynebacterium yudongzhengii]AWB81646.1 chromosome segregation protein SMC [Corynebacterium yudongzhengii]PWC01551.1 chromosome segregation protein SMC [Corynebacterium yudongzhengii]